MSARAPFTAMKLEDQTTRLKLLLKIVADLLDRSAQGDSDDDADLLAGAEICLHYAIDVLDGIKAGTDARDIPILAGRSPAPEIVGGEAL